MIRMPYLKTIASLLSLALASQACTVVTKNPDDDTDETEESDLGGETEGSDAGDTETEASDAEDTEVEGSDAEDSDAEDSGAEDSDAEDSGAGSDADDDAGADVDGGAEEGDGGEAETDTAEGDGGSGGGGEVKTGSISLTQSVLVVAALPDPIVSASITGAFTMTSTTEQAEIDCESTTVDSCTMTVCAIPDGNGGSSTSVTVSAGDITVSGLRSTPAVAYNEATGIYSSTPTADYLWDESVEATVEATGSDDVPAFSMDLTLPDLITVTAPEADALSNFAISRSSDLDVEWEGGGEGMVSVSLSGATNDETIAISCVVPSDEGGVSVDASLLEPLPDTGAMSISATASATSDIGDDWMISFSGTNLGASGTTTVTD